MTAAEIAARMKHLSELARARGHTYVAMGFDLFDSMRQVVEGAARNSELEAEAERLKAKPRPMSETELVALPTHPLANWRDGLDVGIHRVHWKTGGTSIIAVGQMSDGRKWFAPLNWIAPSTDPTADFWSLIERTDLLISYPDFESEQMQA